MARLDFHDLAERVSSNPSLELTGSARLEIPSEPRPFVPPKLVCGDLDDDADPLAAEVVVVSAPAAVGKSTVARFLAATRAAPLLDLAVVPVSTQSLLGLLAADVSDPRDAISAVHSGGLTVIVDALDEGRMLSGDANFEQFLETTWELLRQDRSVIDRPKLVLFGRDIAAEILDLALQISGEGISSSWLKLDFFGHDDAIAVVEAHASETAARDGSTWQSSAPAREVISAFFGAIEGALGLEDGAVWTDAQGRAFAGYAPVLGAIGSLLARETNPQRLTNALKLAGAERAWDVIERVAETIMERERDEKLCPPLAQVTSTDLPVETYDREEQLTLLAQLAQGRSLKMTGRVGLSGSDADAYNRMVAQHLGEHPFLQQGQLANDVVAAIVLAHAAVHDLVEPQSMELVRRASRLPFLWRSTQRQLELASSNLISGQYLGCVLNSLWNDAIVEAPRVSAAASPDTDVSDIRVRGARNVNWSVSAIHPLELYEQVRDSQFLLAGPVVWRGHAGVQGSTAFDVRGDVTLVTESELDIQAAAIRIDGDARLAAAQLAQPPELRVIPSKSAQLWRGGQFSDTHPWTQVPSTLEPPTELGPQGELARLVRRCGERLGGVAITLTADYRPTEDPRYDWVGREFSVDAFAKIISLMVQHGLARADTIPARGPRPRVVIHFQVTWDELAAALDGSTDAPAYVRGFIDEARPIVEVADEG